MNAGTAVAVMLAQMQNKTPPRNLTVKRGGRVEAMIPIDREAKEPQVELVCLLYIKYTQNGDDRTKPDLHNCVPSEDRALPSPTFIGRIMRLLPLRPAADTYRRLSAAAFGARLPLFHSRPWTDLPIWRHRRCASTHRALLLLCVQPSIGGADRDPFHVPGAGAASCRRSNFGQVIGCSGARFVNPDSPLRQAHSPAETGTVSISPARAMSISCPVGDTARLVIAHRNCGTARYSSTRDTSVCSRQRSSG